MRWIEVTAKTAEGMADRVADLLMDAGAKGTAWEAKPSHIVGGGDGDAAARMAAVRAYFPEGVDPVRLIERLEAVFGSDPELGGSGEGDAMGPVFEFRYVEDEDWGSAWKAYFKPLKIGRRLVIRPSWEPYAAGPGDLVITLDPGMAFGTGDHPTTAMCLELLEDEMGARTSAKGPVALDVGTGSGILSVALAMLGASRVVAVDIDETAVGIARDNARLNGVEDRVEVIHGDISAAFGRTGPADRFDLVVANILAPVIASIAPAVSEGLKEGGAFICSGIFRDQAESVEEALIASGFSDLKPVTSGEWVAFRCRKRCGG